METHGTDNATIQVRFLVEENFFGMCGKGGSTFL